jgi:hypothetical protein
MYAKVGADVGVGVMNELGRELCRQRYEIAADDEDEDTDRL